MSHLIVTHSRFQSLTEIHVQHAEHKQQYRSHGLPSGKPSTATLAHSLSSQGGVAGCQVHVSAMLVISTAYRHQPLIMTAESRMWPPGLVCYCSCMLAVQECRARRPYSGHLPDGDHTNASGTFYADHSFSKQDRKRMVIRR